MSKVTVTPLQRPQHTLTLELGTDTPRFTNGIAKWNEIERPRRRNVLEYGSESLGKLTFDVLLDQFPDGTVEDQIGIIFAWAARVDLPFQPSILRIEGPVPYTQLPYVLTGVDDSGICERRSDGARCRQQLKLEFTEYMAPDLIVQTPPPAQAAQDRNGTSTAAAQKTYTVKRGDTLYGIAASLLGNGNRWHEIANNNGVRDPKSLKPGQVLRIP